MAKVKIEQGIVAIVPLIEKRCQEFTEAMAHSSTPGFDFNDLVLRFSGEMIKYGNHMQLSLLMHNAAAASAPAPTAAPKRALTAQEQAQMQGATEEEKALVERTPPPGFNT